MWLFLLLLILPWFSGGFISDKETNWLTENGVPNTISGKSGCFSKNSTIQSSFTSLENLVDKCDGKDSSPFVYRLTREELRKRSIATEDFYCVFPEEDHDLVSVFVCNPRDFCSIGNPCIRKCCGLNQKLVKTPDIFAPAVCETYNKTINVSFHTTKETSYPTPAKVSGEKPLSWRSPVNVSDFSIWNLPGTTLSETSSRRGYEIVLFRFRNRKSAHDTD